MATDAKSKHRSIYEYLRDAIAAGEFAAGEQVPTEAELSQRFGACRQTVAQAIRKLEHQGLVVRRRGAGTFVCPRKQARGTLWGLLVPAAYGGIFAPMGAQMTRAARVAGYSVLLEDPHDGSEDLARLARRAEDLCRAYVDGGVSGVFYIPLILPAEQMHVNAHIVETFDRAGIPVVLLDRDIYEYPRRSRYDLVGVANRRSTQVLTEHLLALGYRRIEFVTHEGLASTASARIAGYQDALRDHGIEPDPAWIHCAHPRRLGAVPALTDTIRAEAFVCVNDEMAARLIRHLAGHGRRVPDDVAVVGFDDAEYSTLVQIPLTTMRQPCERMGDMAVRLMLERLAEPSLPAREVAFDCELIVRDSCGARTRTAGGAACPSTSPAPA